jgi:hypothetical protein
MASSRQPLITPAHVLGLALRALGGHTRLASIRHRTTDGEIEAFNGLVGPYRSYATAPDKLRAEWTIASVTAIVGYDGTIAWEQQGSQVQARTLADAVAARLRQRARFNVILYHIEQQTPMTLVADPSGPEHGSFVIRFDPLHALPEWLALDPVTYLPRWWKRRELYEEGEVDTEEMYHDWRQVDGVMLPYTIGASAPDFSATLRVAVYGHPPDVPDALYHHPLEARWNEPTSVALTTIPRCVCKEPDGILAGTVTRFWGIPNAPMERWLVHVLVQEQLGRFVTPLSATLELFSGRERVKSYLLSAAALHACQRTPVSRFAPQHELYHLRHQFVEPATLAIDRIAYTLTVSLGDRTTTASLDFPVLRYAGRTRLSCPLRGPFMICVGHDPSELSHTYEWSQQFALDLVPVGAAGDSAPGGPAGAHRIAGVHAPADGIVVRARDDVPDDMVPRDYLKLIDPLYAIGGNGVVIDHGTGEYSMLFHLRHGSVCVKAGDHVARGDALGAVGCSGTPGYYHLHYHLQAGPDFLGADGLPVHFDNVVLGMDVLGPLRFGTAVAAPVRGLSYTTTEGLRQRGLANQCGQEVT